MQCCDYYRLRVPVGEAWMGKTVNCSCCSKNTHAFVQIWSHPDCVCLIQIFNSVEWNKTFPFLTVSTRQQSGPRASCGEKHSAGDAFWEIKVISVIFQGGMLGFCNNLMQIIAEIADVECFSSPPLTCSDNPVKIKRRTITWFCSTSQTHTSHNDEEGFWRMPIVKGDCAPNIIDS